MKKPDDSDLNARREYLFEKAIDFYHRYDRELKQIRKLLHLRLSQLAYAYTRENQLPCESVLVKTRVKSLESFVNKGMKINLSQFSFPESMVYDLIGARVTCWFLDDCRGISDLITNSNFIHVEPDKVLNYIDNPKPSGYRSIHLHGKIAYERMVSRKGKIELIPEKVVCEIQIRTKLMDTWADLTHEFHYKAKDLGIGDEDLEKVLEAQAKRFFIEDESFVAMRKLYQKMSDDQR